MTRNENACGTRFAHRERCTIRRLVAIAGCVVALHGSIARFDVRPARADDAAARIVAGDAELLKYAFQDRLAPGEQVYPPVTSLTELRQANERMLLPVELYFDAYENLNVVRAEELTLDAEELPVVKLTYELGGRQYETYAYVKKSPIKTSRAALVIPGSASNLATAIYHEIPDGNHTGIMRALGDAFNRYVFIKPNEDCLAIHNGQGKLHPNFYVNWHIEQGGSYSAHYIVSSLAFSKYLQSNYAEFIVAGLSQGGAAALQNALQSNPDAAIIASGFSIINRDAQWAGHNQMIIPGLRKRWDHEAVRKKIAGQATRYLFTYGEKEVGTYRIEATAKPSAEFLRSCQNAEVRTHPGGHEYPADIVADFLERAFPAAGESKPSQD